MNLKQLKVFVTVAEEESITKAAEKLYMAQPAVSQILHDLENEYNLKLFSLVKQRIKITEIGKILKEQAYRVLLEAENFSKCAKEKALYKNVNVSASLSTGEKILPSLFLKYENNKEYNINYKVDTSDNIINDVILSKIDIGIIEGITLDKSLDIYKLYEDELMFICHKDFVIKDEISSFELKDIPLLLRNKGTGSRQTFDNVVKDLANNLNIKCESSNNTALLAFAKYKYGLCVIPKILIKDINFPYKIIKIKDLEFKRNISIIKRKSSFSYINDIVNDILKHKVDI
jgi:DNA-binding transcriptional LysR family regulator